MFRGMFGIVTFAHQITRLPVIKHLTLFNFVIVGIYELFVKELLRVLSLGFIIVDYGQFLLITRTLTTLSILFVSTSNSLRVDVLLAVKVDFDLADLLLLPRKTFISLCI